MNQYETPKHKNLHDLVLHLKRETNKITSNPILDAIDLERVKSFELKGLTDSHYKRKTKEIQKNLESASYIYDKRYQEAFNSYNELINYEFVKERIEIDMIKELKGMKTPDFKFSWKEYSLYSDLKTLHFVGGNSNYDDVQEQAAKSRIKADKEIKARNKGIVFSDPVIISPFKKGNNDKHYNLNIIIENIIDKVVSNYKPDQINYEGISGIYLVDTTILGIPCNLDLGLAVHKGWLNEPNSGILWNVAFGQEGDPIYNWIEFEGKPNLRQRLTKNGILNDRDSLRALAFIVRSSTETKIIGFHRANEQNENLLKVLYKLCDFVNDNTNSKYRYHAK